MRLKNELAKGVLLMDGSMGALLASMGYQTDCPELLNVEKPEVIRGVHARYIEAGAQIVITDSLGTTPVKLSRKGISDRAEELTRAAVKNARAEAGLKCLVALDLGPTGEFLRPVGTLTLKDMIAAFAVAARAGAKEGADFALLETQTDIAECRAACLAAREAGLDVAASFTFNPNGRTLTGGTPECAALTLAAAGACAIGVNCSGGPLEMLSPLKAMRRVSPLPVLVQPNAGLPTVDADGMARYPFSPEDMLPHMKNILDAGASAIGGCCGTTPEHIRLFATLTVGRAAPASGWDGVVRLCSVREYAPADQVRAHLKDAEDADALYDWEQEDGYPLLSIDGMAEEEIIELLEEAQMATSLPLTFRADEKETLEIALLHYAGVAGVLSGGETDEVIKKYGAVKL